MTDSPADHRAQRPPAEMPPRPRPAFILPGGILLAGILLAGLVPGSTDAYAQGAPKLLLPALGAPAPATPAAPQDAPRTGQATGQATGRTGGNAGGQATAPAPGNAPENITGGTVRINDLDAVSAETIGTIGGNEAALPASMWNGTPRPAIERLLGLVGDTPATASLRRLLLRILLSPAAVPPAASPSTGRADATGPGGIVRARLGALERLGAWKDYIRLLDLAPPTGSGPGNILPPARRARLKADAGFLIGDTDTACTIARAAMLRLAEDPHWQKAGTFCQALAGEWENVEFNLRLMLELGEDDSRFLLLMRALSSVAPAPDRPAGEAGDISPAPPAPAPPAPALASLPEAAQLRPLDIAMLRAAGIAPGTTDPEALPPALIPALMTFAALPFEERLALAERGERLGLVGRDALIALYELVDIDAAQMENALTVAATDPGANSRALLYRATASQTLHLARAEAIRQALALARRDGHYAQTARLYAPLIEGIPATSPYSWFAAEAASAFFAAGMGEEGGPWLALATREARRNPEAAMAWREAKLLQRLGAGERAPLEDGFLNGWWRALRAVAPEAAPARATLLFGLLEATGAETPGPLWRGLIDRTEPETYLVPPAALLRARRGAVARGHLGEGALLTVLSLSGAGPDAFAPLHLTESIRALRRLGLEDDANRLALDIYLAHTEVPARLPDAPLPGETPLDATSPGQTSPGQTPLGE